MHSQIWPTTSIWCFHKWCVAIQVTREIYYVNNFGPFSIPTNLPVHCTGNQGWRVHHTQSDSRRHKQSIWSDAWRRLPPGCAWYPSVNFSICVLCLISCQLLAPVYILHILCNKRTLLLNMIGSYFVMNCENWTSFWPVLRPLILFVLPYRFYGCEWWLNSVTLNGQFNYLPNWKRRSTAIRLTMICCRKEKWPSIVSCSYFMVQVNWMV